MQTQAPGRGPATRRRRLLQRPSESAVATSPSAPARHGPRVPMPAAAPTATSAGGREDHSQGGGGGGSGGRGRGSCSTCTWVQDRGCEERAIQAT